MNLLGYPRVVGDEELQQLVDGLYRSRYFRQRPRVTQLLLTTLRESMQQVPARLRMFFLWGVHGKPDIGLDDRKALEYLFELLGYLSRQLDMKTEMTLVICDTHGAVNHAPREGMESYIEGIESSATEYGWPTLRMSTLWEDEGITLEAVRKRAPALDIPREASRLVQFAGQYYLGDDPAKGAREYLAARLLERSILSRRFKGFIHVTPVEPSLQFLQPELPEFYVWIGKRGNSVKPWFPIGAGRCVA